MPEVIFPPYLEEDEKKVEKLKRGILNGRIKPEEVSLEDAHLLYRKDVIEAMIESMKKHGQYFFLCHFGKDLGQPFIDILKENTVNFYGKYPQNPVDVVWKLVGAAENDWYLSLVDKYVSPDVKTSLIEALQGSTDNVDMLIKFYKKGKAAEKRAALSALAKLNPPEAEPIFKKIIEKDNKDHLLYIQRSENALCEEYRKSKLDEALNALFEYAELEQADRNVIYSKACDVMHYCKYTLDEEEIFLKIARARITESVNWLLNSYMMGTLREGWDVGLAQCLYDKEPELFGLSHAFKEFIEDPLNCYSKLGNLSLHNRKEFMNILKKIKYIPYEDKYYYEFFSYCLFDEFPDALWDFLCDDFYMTSTHINDPKHIEILKATCEACEFLKNMSTNENLLERHRQKVCDVAEEFAVKVAMAGYANYSCMQIIAKNPNILKGRCSGLYTLYIWNQLMISKNPFTDYNTLKVLPMSKKEKLTELCKLRKELCEMIGIPEDTPVGQTWTHHFAYKGEGTVHFLKQAIKELEDEIKQERRKNFTVFEGGIKGVFRVENDKR